MVNFSLSGGFCNEPQTFKYAALRTGHKRVPKMFTFPLPTQLRPLTRSHQTLSSDLLIQASVAVPDSVKCITNAYTKSLVFY